MEKSKNPEFNIDYKEEAKRMLNKHDGKIPTLDKMLEIKEQSQLCGEFLEWLQGKYAMFELKTPRDDPFYRGTGDYINSEKLLAEFFGIDLEEAEEEKDALLKSL
jgi:hypothetical protein